MQYRFTVDILAVHILQSKERDKIEFTGRTKVEDKFPTFLLVGTVLALIAVSFIPYKDAAAPGQFYKPDITNGVICMVFCIITVAQEFWLNRDTDKIKAIPIIPILPANDVRIVRAFLVSRLFRLNLKAVVKFIDVLLKFAFSISFYLNLMSLAKDFSVINFPSLFFK